MERLLISAVLPFIISLLIIPMLIKFDHKKGWEQKIREQGPENHKKKENTASFGGIIILLSTVVTLIVTHQFYPTTLIILAMFIFHSLTGFVDDYLKIARKQTLGLRARDKFILQIISGFALAFVLTKYMGFPPTIEIPFTQITINSVYLFYFLTVIIVTSTTNAVNLTDGLDGLASGVAVSAFAALAYIATKQYQYEISYFALTLMSAVLGFMWFNIFPAKIFMGDTGSLGLGGALATIAILTKSEILLLVIGGIFVVETLSVIIQVTYFKITKGKRIFKMSPLHHHLELCGWPETWITIRFWLISILLGAIGIYIAMLRLW